MKHTNTSTTAATSAGSSWEDLVVAPSGEDLVAIAAPQTALRPALLGGAKKRKTDTFLEGIRIVEADTGKVISSSNVTSLFNPASNTKLATTLAVLQRFGPEYRFATEICIDGTISGGALEGDLYVSGCYMLFGDRQAQELAQLLNARGIKKVQGNLCVSPAFSMNLHSTALDAGKKLLAVLDPGYGQRKASKRKRRGKSVATVASAVEIEGKLMLCLPPEHSVVLCVHNSPPLKDIAKIMLCYSDNTMAERFGDMIGGAAALTSFVVDKLGVASQEASFASTSGLGINRLSARAMCTIVTALRAELKKWKLSLSDLLAVAGVDEGTLKHRLNQPGQSGSVVGKTGTLPETDQGVSTLSGEINTADGATYLFVIFHMHGDVLSFRQRQDALVTKFQNSHGGARPLPYTPILPRIEQEDFWR